MRDKNRFSNILKFLIHFKGFSWILLSVISPFIMSGGPISWIILSMLMMINGCLFLYSSLHWDSFTKKDKKFVSGLVLINLILGFTDQIGFADILSIVFDTILLSGVIYHLSKLHEDD